MLSLVQVRLVQTLWRFDEVYVVYFKTNGALIRDYPNISNYVRELYQMPGVASTVNLEHIKAHYYTSHKALNAYSIIPVGFGSEDEFKKPHNRNRFAK